VNRFNLLSFAFKFSAIVACILLSAQGLAAAPVTADTAAKAVQGWLHQDLRPLGKSLSSTIKSTEAVKNAAGQTVYFVVHLSPSGFVILPADDAADPIVAFSATGAFDSASKSPLTAMVNRDAPIRLARARAAAGTARAANARHKWNAFLAGSPNPPPDSEENGNIVVASQVWVAPFVQTLWDQSADMSGNDACYNYYTPPYAAGTVENDPCGCVATALAQELYYFQYPNVGVGTATFTITNNGAAQTTQLLGGNGAGGVYAWSTMLLSPNNPTAAQATAIGALTHDAGAAVQMSYTPDDSSAYTYLAQQALTNTFKFANAAYIENDNNGVTGTNLLEILNPNLDARLPVILGIEPDGGHCLLCDGYGYSSSTLFYHLNAGWGGDDDIWYALPDIDTPDVGVFTSVVACIYNIYTNGNGQIISGRVTDPNGAPIVGATVTATRNSGGVFSTTTDTNGIYALARVPAASTYALTVANAGDSSASGNFSTGTYVYGQPVSGNVWGANFTLSPALLVTPEAGFAAIGPTNGPFSVTSHAYVLTNTSASAVNWILSSIPDWLSATSTNGTLASGTASGLTIFLNAAASSLTAGNYSTVVWITNVSSGISQALTFSLSVETADYPLAVSGFNMDVIVENNAVGGNTYNYADAFDPDYPFLSPAGPACFYEAGLVAADIFGGTAVLGLPPGRLFTNEFNHATVFQFAPYNSSNVLYLTASAPSGSLTFNSPMACKSLSVLAGSAQGGGNGSLVIHFVNGASSSAISFNAPNYLTTNSPSSGAAITNFGLLVVGGPFNEFDSLDPSFAVFPTLYQTSINLASLGLTQQITSVTFTMPNSTNASCVTGVFAVSGTESLSVVSNSPVSFLTSAGALGYFGGRFTLQLTNLTGQGQVVIDASTNLLQWVPIYTNPSTFGTFSFIDTNAAAFPLRFYRATTP
jgi:hypothetical protein